MSTTCRDDALGLAAACVDAAPFPPPLILRAASPPAQSRVVLARRLVQGLGVASQVGVAPHVLRLRAAHDRPRPAGARPPHEHHHPCAAAGQRQIEEGRGHPEGASRAPRDSLVGRDRPRVLPKILEDGFEGHDALGHGEEESAQGLLAGRLGHRRIRLLLLRLPSRSRRGGGSPASPRRRRHDPAVATQELPDLLGSVLLVAPDHVRLRQSLESQLVNLNVRPEGDEPHEAVLRQQVQRLLYRVGELGELLHVHARVEAEDEGGRAGVRDARQLVLARRELGHELGGQGHLRSVLGVVRREVIAGEAEGARPQLRAVIDLAVRIQHRVAGGGRAADGIVLQSHGGGAVGRELLEGGVQGADGGDASRRLEAGRRPAVEGEAGTALLLALGDVPVLVSLHDDRYGGAGGQGMEGSWEVGVEVVGGRESSVSVVATINLYFIK